MLESKTPQIQAKLGNEDLLKLHKTAFLCSRVVPASIVLKSYDWAIEQRKAGKCVISGFHSRTSRRLNACNGVFNNDALGGCNAQVLRGKEEIGRVFAGFQKYLYQLQEAA